MRRFFTTIFCLLLGFIFALYCYLSYIMLNLKATQALHSPTRLIPKDAIVKIKIDDTIFAIPAMYLLSWPRPDALGKINIPLKPKEFPPGFSFAFWMPNRRPEEFKSEPPMMVSELVRQGARPKEGEFPVVVNTARIIPERETNISFPYERFENFKRAMGKENGNYAEIFGLTYYKFSSDNSDLDHYYRRDNKIDIQFRCDPITFNIPNPLCQGYVFYINERVSFIYNFPTPFMPHWRESADAVKDLISQWRQP